MNKLKKRFTKWYYKKGYKFGYNNPIFPESAYWKCPWYVKPLLIFFSPSYYCMCYSSDIVKHFKRGMEEGQKWVDKTGTILEQLQNMNENTVEDQ